MIPILLLNTVLGDCLTLNRGGLPDDQFDHFAGGLFAPDIAHFLVSLHVSFMCIDSQGNVPMFEFTLQWVCAKGFPIKKSLCHMIRI